MSLLLDECVDRRLARDLADHYVQTVPQMGWAGKRNGDLLRLAERDFDIFLTVDRKLQHQQNLAAFDIAIIVLVSKGHSLADLRPVVSRALARFHDAVVGRALVVD